MSILSDIGGFITDNVGDLFDSDIFSTQNILSTLGGFASVWNQNNAQKQAEEAARSQFDQQVALLGIKHQQDMEMQKLIASLRASGGGGGGGGHPDYEGIEKLRAMMQAKELQANQANTGANLTVQAINNLLAGAQRPLVR